jgi:hypothetical protein
MTRHCHNCGWEWKDEGPPGRSDTCAQCHAELRVCLNCARHDPRAAYECAEPKADPVLDKDRANYCEWFAFAKRVYRPKTGRDRAADARDAFKKLFGD